GQTPPGSVPQGDDDPARGLGIEAVARRAADLPGVLDRGLDQPRPHAAVDLADLRTVDDERSQRARRRRDHRLALPDLGDLRLVAEGADRSAYPLQRVAQVARRAEAGLLDEPAGQRPPDLVQPPGPLALRERVDEQADELVVGTLRELDLRGLRRRRVDVRRPARAGA